MSTGHTGPMILAFHGPCTIGGIWRPHLEYLPGTHTPAPPVLIVRQASQDEYLACCIERGITPTPEQEQSKYFYEVVTD